MTRRMTLGLVAAVLAALAAGCGPIVVAGARLAMPDTTTIKAEYTIGATPVVVIPFRDAGRTYYESGDGLDLASAVSGELMTRKAATVVRSDEAVRAKFAGQNLEQAGWAEVGRAADATLVLTGDIQTFRLKDPGVIGMLRGYSLVSVRLYDVSKNCLVYSASGIETWVPEYGAGVAESDVNPEKLRNALVASTAMKIVQKFYTWERKIGPEPRRY